MTKSHGQVYFIQVGTDGPIKIGYTKTDVRRRVRALQMVSPHILRWIGVFPGTREDERVAHKLLCNSSLRGEWFHPTKEVLAFVDQMSPGFAPLSVENVLFHPHRIKGRPSVWKVEDARAIAPQSSAEGRAQ